MYIDNMNTNNEESASQITDMNNNRIYDRNVPSSSLQPYFSLRPTQTKYTKFMTDIPPVQSSVPLKQVPSYSPHTTFYPANKNAPWNGFATNVDVESDMRNQFYALQACPQATYVPQSESDLYTLRSFAHASKPNAQTHPLLFNEQRFDMFNPNVTGLSDGIFNNHTRQDIKNSK
jgi:hypothetical protein|uniref:Uncharacterized protein n=1 Tax=viral metagenome TaxID=1070528 RepID=A0A6C0IK84_9ZZZZ